MKNCKSVIAEKVEKLAEKEGIVIGSVDVGIKNKNDEIDIYNIDVEIITDNKKDVSQKRDDGEKEIDRVTVDVINIGNEKKIRKKDSFVYLLATIRMIIESKINGIDCGVRKCLEKMFPRHKNNRKNNKKISRLISLELFLSKI